mgnify:CR=1 FL=1
MASASGENGRFNMLYWALSFFAMALVTALLGYAGIAAEATPLLKISFLAFFILALLSFVVQAARRT